jgi:prepilin signal peptidase PulO-like enzyme (type II secretory pathway)
VIRQQHHIIAHILQLLAGGWLGLFAAAIAHQFGTRSADRMPGESRWPHCFYCLQPLTWQESFPLIGWLLRPDVLTLPCPCGKRVDQWPQPAAEILGFLFGIFGMYLVDWSVPAAPLCIGLGLMVAIALVDLQFGIIPDGLNMLLALDGAWWVWKSGGDFYLALAVSGALLAVGLFCALGYSRWRGREMLGIGDVKFFAVAGLWLPFDQAPWFLVLAGIFGVALSFAWRRAGGGKEFPFAPALCLSLIICLLLPIARQVWLAP